MIIIHNTVSERKKYVVQIESIIGRNFSPDNPNIKIT